MTPGRDDSGYGARMSEEISRGELASVVESLRRVLASIDTGQLSCSAAYRNRLQGAVVALESLAEGEREETGEAPGSTA